MDPNDLELKKRIEQNRQEALRRLAMNKALVQPNKSSNLKSPITSSNNRFSPYSHQKPATPQSVSNFPTTTTSSTANTSKAAVPSTSSNRYSPYPPQNPLKPQASTNVQEKKVTNNPWAPKIPTVIKPQQSYANSPKGNVENSKQAATTSNQSVVLKTCVKCTIEIISDSRFQVRTSTYDQAVIDEMRKIKSKSWNATAKVWSFALTDYKLLVSSLETKFKSSVEIAKIPDFVICSLLRPSPPLDESCLDNIDQKLLDSLMPFQKAGVIFGISKNGRVLICDDPGLGKTRQALGIANFYKDDGPVLIVTNASTREFWKSEILKVFDICDKYVRIIPSYIDEAKYVICSYHMLNDNIGPLLNKNFPIIIFDESHHIKNPRAQQTKNSQKLCKQAKRIIMLSGTPALSRPVELFPQLEILDKSFATFNQYAMRYCQGQQTNFGFNANGSANMGELEILLKKRFMIRRIKTDVYDQLHSKQRECVTLVNLEFTETEQEDNEDYKSQMGTRIDNATAKDQILIMWYNSTALLKAKASCAYIENLLKKTDEKILAFCHHAVMMNALSAHMEKLNVSHIRIDGSTNGALRSERIEAFQNNSNIRIAVLSTLASNAGITLTAASIVVFCELEFNPSTIIQAEGRAHRIGQTRQVKVHFLLAPGTADDVIWKMLMKKQSNLGKAGLVDSIEYLANTMKESKFDCKIPSGQEVNNDDSKELDENENESSDTFYSCASTIEQPAQTNQQKFIDALQMTAEEIEEIRKIEEEMSGF